MNGIWIFGNFLQGGVHVHFYGEKVTFIRLLLCWLKSEFLIKSHNLAPPCHFIFFSSFLNIILLNLSCHKMFSVLCAFTPSFPYYQKHSFSFFHQLLVILCDLYWLSCLSLNGHASVFSMILKSSGFHLLKTVSFLKKEPIWRYRTWNSTRFSSRVWTMLETFGSHQVLLPWKKMKRPKENLKENVSNS